MKVSTPFRVLAIALAVIVGVLTSLASAGPLVDSRTPMTKTLADADASPRTAALFSFLKAQKGRGVLFGHQQDTEVGVTFASESADGFQSDVQAGVGDHPAVFGWDFGHQGYGLASGSSTPEEGLQHTIELVKAADRLGAVQTFSAHMDNFVTGGSFDDTDGKVVARIMPGGDRNQHFTDYLDRVAHIASAAVDDHGAAIPLIFRPFHENAGSWFWWGAASTSPSEYIELFRYTVEYLRDIKKVHNFLYAYSPGGSFGGRSEVFLRTYPGDDFVDILGYDNYDPSGGSQQWLSKLVGDLAMMARLADEHTKVAALTEFGVSGGLKPNRQNADVNWYTHVLTAIKADPYASRIVWMLTWANYGISQFFVPYPAAAGLDEHEMLADFRSFHADDFTIFNSDLPPATWRYTPADPRS